MPDDTEYLTLSSAKTVTFTVSDAYAFGGWIADEVEANIRRATADDDDEELDFQS